jgi:hypothetical protein
VGAHPASYTMGTGSFPRVKRPGRGGDHPPHLVPRLKKCRAIPLLHLWAFVACFWETFTFTVVTSTPFERCHIFTRIKGLLSLLCWNVARLVTEVWYNASVPSPRDYLKMGPKHCPAASVTKYEHRPRHVPKRLRPSTTPRRKPENSITVILAGHN